MLSPFPVEVLLLAHAFADRALLLSHFLLHLAHPCARLLHLLPDGLLFPALFPFPLLRRLSFAIPAPLRFSSVPRLVFLHFARLLLHARQSRLELLFPPPQHFALFFLFAGLFSAFPLAELARVVHPPFQFSELLPFLALRLFEQPRLLQNCSFGDSGHLSEEFSVMQPRVHLCSRLRLRLPRVFPRLLRFFRLSPLLPPRFAPQRHLPRARLCALQLPLDALPPSPLFLFDFPQAFPFRRNLLSLGQLRGHFLDKPDFLHARPRQVELAHLRHPLRLSRLSRAFSNDFVAILDVAHHLVELLLLFALLGLTGHILAQLLEQLPHFAFLRAQGLQKQLDWSGYPDIRGRRPFPGAERPARAGPACSAEI